MCVRVCAVMPVYVLMTRQFDKWKGPEDPLEESAGHAASPRQQQPLADSDHFTVATSGFGGEGWGLPVRSEGGEGVPPWMHRSLFTSLTPPLFFVTGFLIGWRVCVASPHVQRGGAGCDCGWVGVCEGISVCAVFKLILGVPWCDGLCVGDKLCDASVAVVRQHQYHAC